MAQMTESGRVPAKLGDQIGLYSAFQPVEKPISGFRNHGLHGCDGAALERFVNKAAQAAMLRIVLAEMFSARTLIVLGRHLSMR
jgi:hypothetical protein